jgi:hypothetical protein
LAIQFFIPRWCWCCCIFEHGKSQDWEDLT